MIETLRDKEAFEYYYSLGAERNLEKVSQKYSVSVPAVKKWSKNFNWQFRVEQRDIENGKKIEQKTNNEVINAKADFRKTIFSVHQNLKKSLNELIRRNETIQIIDIRDLEKAVIVLDKIARLDMGLVGENIEGEATDDNIAGILWRKIQQSQGGS